MITTLKLTSNSVTLGASANNIFGQKSIYVTNSNTTVGALITVANSGASQLSQGVIPPLGQLSIQKNPTDTLVSNLTAGVFASACAFTN